MNFMFFIYNLNYNYLVPNLFFNQPEPARPTLQLLIFSYLLDLINYPSLRYQLGSRSTWSTSHIIHSTSIDYKNIYIILGALGVNVVLRVVEVLGVPSTSSTPPASTKFQVFTLCELSICQIRFLFYKIRKF